MQRISVRAIWTYLCVVVPRLVTFSTVSVPHGVLSASVSVTFADQ